MLFASGDELPQPRIAIDSNESAFGPSRHAVDAIVGSARLSARYAVGADAALCAALARKLSLDESRIVVGHGSDDLLARLARAYLRPGDELICSRHGYQKIPNYAFANDATPVLALDRDFTADVDSIVDCVTDRTRMVMLANPDNPTGTWLSGAEVRRLRDELRSDILLVLDSAYLEYIDAEDFEDPTALVEERENVVMTRTFSKIYGLAGVRIGWLYGSHRVADSTRRIGLTFPVSNLAFEAAMAALEDSGHARMVFEQNAEIKSEFISRLRNLGLHVYPSQTNFVLVRFPGGDAVHAFQNLLAQGIFARRLASEAFIDCIRFTIGLAGEMEAVAYALERFYQDRSAVQADE